MTSFFTTFTAGVSIDRRPDHYPPAAPEQPVQQAQAAAPEARASLLTAARRRFDALSVVWRKLRL